MSSENCSVWTRCRGNTCWIRFPRVSASRYGGSEEFYVVLMMQVACSTTVQTELSRDIYTYIIKSTLFIIILKLLTEFPSELSFMMVE